MGIARTIFGVSSGLLAAASLTGLAAMGIETTTELEGKITLDCPTQIGFAFNEKGGIESVTEKPVCPRYGFTRFFLEMDKGERYYVGLHGSLPQAVFDGTDRVSVTFKSTAADDALDFLTRTSARYLSEDYPYVLFPAYGSTKLDNIPVQALKPLPPQG